MSLTLMALAALAASPILDDGRARLDDGDARGAMLRAEQAVRADPGDAEARLLLAEALLVLGEADRAEKMARAALRDGAGDDGRLALAEALYALGRFEDAKASAEAAAPSVRRAAIVGLADAERSLRDGAPEAALGALRAAIAAPGFERRAELAAARAQYARGDLVRAQRLLDGLIASDDTSFPALLLRARVALRSGDAARAGTLATAMLARDPGNVSAGALAIEAALRRGDAEAARRHLGALAPLGEDPRPAYLAALVLLQEGRVREAGDAVAPIEGWLRDLDGGAVLMARIRAETGRLAQAEKVLRDRLRARPGDADAAAMLVDVLERAGKADRADEVLSDARRAAPEAPVLRALEAERLIARGEPDAGLALLDEEDPVRRALLGALFGGDVAARPASDLALSYAALRRGDAPAALAAARRAVDAAPTPAALNLLAAAQARSGDEAAARETLRAAIEADPDFLAPVANLAALDGEGALLDGLRRAREAGAKSPAVLTQLATEAFAAGAETEALSAARAAAADGAPEGLLFLARLQVARGEDPAAALAPLLSESEDAGTVMRAAALAEAAGRAALAAPALARLARRTDDPGHHLAAAAAAEAAGDDRAATLSARRARQAAPADARTAAALIAYETKVLGLDAGLGAAKEAAPLSPAHARAVAYEAHGQRGAALAALAEADGLDGRGLLYWLSLSGGGEDAVSALSAHAAANPGDVGALVGLSAALIEAGRTTAAEDALRRALAAAPNDPVLTNNLAALRALRDPAEGLRLAEAAYGRAPGNPAIAETYAEMLTAAGRTADARQVLRRARLGAPGDAGLRAAEDALTDG